MGEPRNEWFGPGQPGIDHGSDLDEQRRLDDELVGLDRDDPEVQAFAEHLQRVHRPRPGYTVEGYLSGIADFADSSNRAVGLRRQAAVAVVLLLLLGVAVTVLDALGAVLSTVL